MSRPPWIYRLIAYVTRPVFDACSGSRRGGSSGLPSDGFVLAANHVSNLDPWPLGLPLFPKRWLRFMAKSELYWWPLSRVLDGAGAFKVRRGEGDVDAIDTAVELVRSGEIVMMFPEGTRQTEGPAEEADREAAHRRRADRAPGRRAARPRGDQGHRPALASRRS